MSSLLLRRGFMMAILMRKYYLLHYIQHYERMHRGGYKTGGGVLLAVKTGLLAYRRPGLEPQIYKILCGLVSPNSFKAIFCLCYRPPNCSFFMDYFECLQICVKSQLGLHCWQFQHAYNQLGICYIDLSNSTDGIKFWNLIDSHFLTVQVVKKPTRISHCGKTVLDLVFYNYPR